MNISHFQLLAVKVSSYRYANGVRDGSPGMPAQGGYPGPL